MDAELGPGWSPHPVLRDLERNLIWNQALTMANHAQSLRALAARLGAESAIAERLAIESERVLQTIEGQSGLPVAR